MLCKACKVNEANEMLDGMCRLCDMFACSTPPGSSTDREFLQGTENGRQFENNPMAGNFYAKVAKKAGINIKGKVYKSSLAKYAGDPEAWVGGRDDVRRICEKNGWSCEGAVNTKLRGDLEPNKPVEVAKHILDEHVDRQIPEGVKLSPREMADLREKTFNRLKPPKAKKPPTRKPRKRD